MGNRELAWKRQPARERRALEDGDLKPLWDAL